MSNETKKPYLLMIVLGAIVIALLASIDLSGVWNSNKESVKDYTAHDAIFPFTWDFKICDEVWIDSNGTRVKVVNFEYDTWECTNQNEHHDCEVWHRKNYTHPKLAYMKGWTDVEHESDIKMSYTYDTVGNVLRVIEEEEWQGRTLIHDRALKYDGHKIAAMITQFFTVKDGKVEDTLSLRHDRYTYKDGKLDSVYVKIIDAKKELLESARSCEVNNPLECYTGPNATFNPYAASELVYEHLRAGYDDKMFEKFNTTDSTMRIIKYCHDADFSFEISEALPKSNYPGVIK